MTIQIETYQIVMIAFAIIAGFWALGKLIVRQTSADLERRFLQISSHLGEQDGKLGSLERAFHEFRVEVARDYIHRDDYIRDIGTLGTKFEALAINVERMFHEQTRDTLQMIKAELRK